MRGDPNSALWRGLAAVAALAVLIIVLMLAFPGAVRSPGEWSSVAYGVGLVFLLMAGGLHLGTTGARQGLRYGAIWLAVFGGLTLLVTFLQGRAG